MIKARIKFLQYLQITENIIWKIEEDNINEDVEFVSKQIDFNYPNSFMLIISQMLYSSFISQMKNINVYIKFVREFSTKNIEFNLIDSFAYFLLHLKSQESKYILLMMHEQNLINTKILKSLKQLKSSISHLNGSDDNLSNEEIENHKKLNEERHNPKEIAKIIRNDEIEKLQEISSQTNFDFNQRIEPSIYEICSFINKENVSLIDYAAFFSAVKCFKYLLMNGANVNNTGKYAVAGGNLEIVHLCEQNNSTFKDVYETAIEFHRSDIFKYFYENKIVKIEDIEEIGKKCVFCNNYKIIYFLDKELKKDVMMSTAAESGNIFLFKYFLEGNKMPKDILISSIKSRNFELVKYIIEQGNNINDIDFCLFFP